MIKHLLFLFQLVLLIVGCSACIDSERQALFSFKKGINNDPYESLSSWGDKIKCCEWEGITCDNVTGHVTHLQLSQAWLSGNITPSLLSLKHLTHLDLNFNHFGQIPSFLGSMVSLTHLDLTDSSVGMIPPQLGNLSNLHHLGIGYSYEGQLYPNKLDWLSGLPLLEILDMSYVNLSQASNSLVSVVSTMPCLLKLRLYGCEINQIHIPSHLHLINLTSLQVLDLSENNLGNPQLLCTFLKNMTRLQSLDLSLNNRLDCTVLLRCLGNTLFSLHHLYLMGTGLQGVIPSAIGNLTSLLTLDLSQNYLHGKIPSSLGTLCNLEELRLSSNEYRENLSNVFQNLSVCLSSSLAYLDISHNQFVGEIPNQIEKFKNLTILSFQNNNLSGLISASLGSLSNLKSLDISFNHLHGVVSEVHFVNLANLKTFEARGNSLTLNVTPSWTPPFDLSSIDLTGWNLGPEFPMWLKSHKNVDKIALSETGISGAIPSWFWNFSSHLNYIDLSNNHLHGVINGFLSAKLQWLDLSYNSFSGELQSLICNSHSSGAYVLQLGDNRLQGNIPDCWEHWTELLMIDLGNNHLIGHIPSSMGLLNELDSLNMGNNNLTGEIPNSLQNCSRLEAINLGRNKFVGTIPRWIGSLTELSILILHSNKLRSEVSYELCALDRLRILDVADNNLYGAIPQCFNNAFAVTGKSRSTIYDGMYYDMTKENAVLVTKGKENEYESILDLVTSIDLSRNNLSGEIPENFTRLQGLRFLNLSRNHLRGSIPRNIGNMTVLESLDLSWNNLSAQIPPTITSLHFLDFLNLSHNNFSGKIPKSTQLQSFNSSSFDGNQLLCGDPLPKCGGDESKEPHMSVPEEDDDEEEYWFRIGVGVGFGVGFLGIIAPLMISRIWRQAFFWFFQEYVWYKILDCIIKTKYLTGIIEPL